MKKEVNSKEVLERVFKRIHEEAEAIRAKERSAWADYLNGLPNEEIFKKNKITKKTLNHLIKNNGVIK